MVSSLFRVVNYQPFDSFFVDTTKTEWVHLTVDPSRRRTRDGLYTDFGVNIVDGVMWFWLLGKWQDLPNELWAWRYAVVRTVGHYYYGFKVWVPSLLLFNFWEYDRSSYAPVLSSTIDRQPVLAAKAIIASWLPRILRSSGGPELRRTCRLVCRDWEKALPFGEPGQCYLQFEDGAVWHWIEQEWWHLPHKYWAWTLCDNKSRVGPPRDRWQLKLVQSVDDSIRLGSKYLFTPSSSLLPSGASRNPGFSRAAAIPQELFKYICNEADSYSWSFRLVSRYWSRQCQPKIFKETYAESPERILLLWTHRMDPLMQQLELIRYVPRNDSNSKFPWLHRLTQLCDSTRSVWTDEYEDLGGILIYGPFASKFGRIRSVHFALPRSLPRSLSRGIKRLDLEDIKFRRFEDLTHLVCELPALEELDCLCDNLDSPPIELPRRPRTNRNKLSKVRVWTDEMKLVPVPSTLRLLLSVYAAPSFFSEGELAVLLALVQFSHLQLENESPRVRYEDHPHNHSRGIVYFRDDDIVFSLHILQDPTWNHIMLNITADCRNKTAEKDWIRLDTEFSKIADLIHRAECVFGFQNHEAMVHFSTNILAKMPSISRLALLRFSINTDDWRGKWYRASLDSEELTGTGERDLAEVYS